MRLCLTSSEVAPFFGWGVGSCVTNYLHALRDAGHEVHLLADDLPGLRAQAPRVLPGITLHTLPALESHHTPFIHTRRPLAVYRALHDLHERHGFDALVFNDFYADAFHVLQARQTLGRFSGATIGILLHSPIALLRPMNRQPEWDLEVAAITHMERACLAMADVLIAPSRAISRQLAALPEFAGHFPPPDSPRVHVIHNPFDPHTFTSALPASPGTPSHEDGTESRQPGHGAASQPGPRDVLFCGRLDLLKGVETLAKAAPQVLDAFPETSLHFVGADTDTAPGRRSMQRYLASLIPSAFASRVHFHNNQPRAKLASFMRLAGVVCVPSLWDNLPNSCLEAMCLGALVVASDAGGIPEIITDGVDGLLCRAGDPADLARVLRRALSDPACEALRRAAPGKVAHLCDPGARARDLTQALEASRPTPRAGTPTSSVRVAAVLTSPNDPALIERSLASLRHQTRPPDQVIVVRTPGAAWDAARPLSSTLHAGGPLVELIESYDPALARNAGISHADADWVISLDAGAALAPTFIEFALRATSLDPGLDVVTTHARCDSDGPGQPDREFVPLGADAEIMRIVNCVGGCASMMRRTLVVAAGGYDAAMVALGDWDLWCTLLGRGAKFGAVPETLAHYSACPDAMPLLEQQNVRARLIHKHAALPGDAARMLRILLGESCHFQRLWQEATPKVPPEPAPLRHRLADQAHKWLAASGLAPTLKPVARAIFERPG